MKDYRVRAPARHMTLRARRSRTVSQAAILNDIARNLRIIQSQMDKINAHVQAIGAGVQAMLSNVQAMRADIQAIRADLLPMQALQSIAGGAVVVRGAIHAPVSDSAIHKAALVDVDQIPSEVPVAGAGAVDGTGTTDVANDTNVSTFGTRA